MEDRSSIPRPLEAFLIIFIGFILTILVTQIVVWLFVPQVEGAIKSSIAMKILLAFGELGLGIVPFVYLKMRNYSILSVFRWRAVPRKIIWISIPIGLSLAILGDELDRIVSLILPAPEILSEIAESLKIATFPELIVMICGAVVSAAIVEESIIRGLLQLSMEKHHNVTRAVIYASLAWTAIHGIIYWALQIFLLGIILGYLAWRTNSIFPSMVCHAINNALALLYYNVKVSEVMPFYTWKGHVSPLLFLPAAYILVKGIQYLDRYYRNFSTSDSGDGTEGRYGER